MEELEERGITIEDHGCFGTESADYPDHAAAVAADVSQGRADQGIIVCKSGIGMSITANKFPGVRAALCVNTETTRLSREHNNANVLCLGSLHTDESKATDILNVWLKTAFAGDRHKRRIDKINSHASEVDGTLTIRQRSRYLQTSPTRGSAAKENIELIASENINSKAVREVQGSRTLTKYAEGYLANAGTTAANGSMAPKRQQSSEPKNSLVPNMPMFNPQGSGANMAVYFSHLQPATPS